MYVCMYVSQSKDAKQRPSSTWKSSKRSLNLFNGVQTIVWIDNSHEIFKKMIKKIIILQIHLNVVSNHLIQ